MFVLKIRFLLIVFFSLILIPCLTFAQTYFQDDFSKDSSKWVDLWGTWTVEKGEYNQSLQDDNCMSLVADNFWKEEWVEYTFEVKAKKTGGNEGFLIMFRLHGAPDPRSRAIREIPARMKDQNPKTEYWWNLGGWANTRSCVERWINGTRIEQANTNDIIKTDEWYKIKIENKKDSYKLYLNDKLISEVNDAEVAGGRIGLAAWQTKAVFDDVVVYGPGGLGTAVDISGKLPIRWGLIKSTY